MNYGEVVTRRQEQVLRQSVLQESQNHNQSCSPKRMFNKERN
jgi:hypothetical protein